MNVRLIRLLELRLFGQFSVRCDGNPVEIPSHPAQSLLAYLALNPDINHRREWLAHLFWPNAPEETGRRNLRQALWQVRKTLDTALPPDGSSRFIRADDLSIALLAAEDCQTDLARFTRKATSQQEQMDAVSAYQGELLPGFEDEWAAVAREQYKVDFDYKMKRLVDPLVAAERWDEVLQWAMHWIEHSRAPEPAFLAEMRAFRGLGDTAGARSAYQRCQETLRRELGVEPSEATRQFYLQLPQPGSRPIVSSIPLTAAQTGRPNNLPLPITRTVGRDRELAEVEKMLRDGRLLTLTGPGGCGKTRLAIETGYRQLENYPDGVWLVDLSQAQDAYQVIPLIARTLDVLSEGRQPLEAVLLDYFRSRCLLLILDNCEHVADETARAVQEILSSASTDLKLLATSQVPLGLPGALEWPVPPLDVPEDGQSLPDVAALIEFSAPRLFIERAADSFPGFALQADEIPTLVEICRRLDGIPLAIELAAARVKLLTLQQIAERLRLAVSEHAQPDSFFAGRDRFALLSTSKRVASRHQALQAAIDWSFGLLNRQQQLLLCRMAVFNGPWTLDAAEGICGYGSIPPTAVLDLLGELVDRSLVAVIQPTTRPDSPATERRFRLLESIRLYGLYHLNPEDQHLLRDRHLQWYTQAAEQGDQQIHGAQQVEWIARLEADLPNSLAAIEWAAGYAFPHPRLLSGLRLACALGWYSRGRSAGDVIHQWIEKLLSLVGPTGDPHWTEAKARAHYSLGRYIWLKGDRAQAKVHQESSAKLWGSLGEHGFTGYARARCHQGFCLPPAEYEQKMAHFQEALALFKRLGDRWGEAEATFHIGVSLVDAQKDREGKVFYDQALSLFHKVGDRQYLGHVNYNLGYFYLQHGQFAEALRHFQESERCFSAIRLALGLALSLQNQADVLLAQGQLAQAEEKYRQTLPLADKLGLRSHAAFAQYRIGQVKLFEQAHPATNPGGAALSEARSHFLAAFQMLQEASGSTLEEDNLTWYTVKGLAACVAARDAGYAARLHGKARFELQRLSERPIALNDAPMEDILHAAADRLGQERYQAMQKEGESLALDWLLFNLPPEEPLEAIFAPAAARSTDGAQPALTPVDAAGLPEATAIDTPHKLTPLQQEKARYAGLTAREREIAVLIALGLTNAAIAGKTMLSERTITTHVSHILNKLGFSSRAQIAAWAVEKGLIQSKK